MTLLQPLGLGFLVLIPIIILFYILRAQHRQRPIPSVMLWREIPSDLEGRPTRRLPLTSLLLLLQLLVVAILVGAISRPSIIGEARRHVIIVLDASVSMQATDVLPNRFAEAKRLARGIIADLDDGDSVSLILAGSVPGVLESGSGTERSMVLAALASAAPENGQSDLAGALALAKSLMDQTESEGIAQNEVVVLSDGAFAPVDMDWSRFRADLEMVTIGSSDRNVAVVELSIRTVPGLVDRHLGYVRTANYSSEEVSVPLRVLVDGILAELHHLTIPPRGQAELTISVPPGSKVVEASLDIDDYFIMDDRALAMVRTERPISVLLVTTNPVFWDRILQAIPMLDVTRVRPATYRPSPADVTIFDGFNPPEWTDGSVLVVNPGSEGVLDVLGESHDAQIVRTDRQSPLLDSVDLGTVLLLHTARVTLPPWARTVVDTDEGPLIFSGVHEGSRIVVFAFDPARSDLPHRIAFPVLMANTLSWLVPPELPTRVSPGEVVNIQPLAEAQHVIVRMPNDRSVIYPNRGGGIRYGQTDEIGSYVITQWSGSQMLARHTFVVSLTDEVLSNIRPDPNALDPPVASASDAAPGIRQEMWPSLVVLALVASLGEWWYYSRRTT